MLVTLSDLLDNRSINWKDVENHLKTKPGELEDFLFIIHFKRKKKIPQIVNKNILTLLSIAYHITNDIRYYNEFLWFYSRKNPDSTLKDECDKLFLKNVNSSGFHNHTFDLSKLEFLIKQNEGIKNDATISEKRIGLIGVPIFFGKIHKELKRKGANVKQLFFPFHPSKVISSLFKNKVIVKISCLLYKNPFPYTTIREEIKDPAIFHRLTSFQFDIGFHKLNFIIKHNIFKAFRLGLINDHWGPLPFIRGKSTIAYTILLGFPMIVTTHLIEQGIDTGKIIRFYKYEVGSFKKIDSIKKKIKKDLSHRIITSILSVFSSNFKFIENVKEEGLTFYEIHPFLTDYIEREILTKNNYSKVS